MNYLDDPIETDPEVFEEEFENLLEEENIETYDDPIKMAEMTVVYNEDQFER